jgi:hypothetical protein
VRLEKNIQRQWQKKLGYSKKLSQNGERKQKEIYTAYSSIIIICSLWNNSRSGIDQRLSQTRKRKRGIRGGTNTNWSLLFHFPKSMLKYINDLLTILQSPEGNPGDEDRDTNMQRINIFKYCFVTTIFSGFLFD